MTPHPQPQSSRGHVPARTVRRSAALVGAVLMLAGTPFVARAIGADTPPPSPSPIPSGVRAPERASASATAALPAAPAPAAVAPVAVAPVDPVIVALSDTYAWDERSARVTVLQQRLGIRADGWYGPATQRAHRGALEFLGLPTDVVPVPVLPPGPDPSEWAALRDCESNGYYAITSRTGKYRGAYQFDRSTWNSVAGRHAPQLVGVDPAAASPADQDAMALALYSERGARPWPHCGRHLS